MEVEYGISSLEILESLPRDERMTGRELTEALRGKPGLVGRLPIEVYSIDNKKNLFEALDWIYAKKTTGGNAPILHFETHGEPAYMLLANGDRVSWRELAGSLARFNVATRFNSLVVMACCDGLHQIKALTTDDVCPFSALVGCEGTIYPSELIRGFELFYETLLNEGQGAKARDQLQSAVVKSKGTRFKLFSCEFAFAEVAKNITAQINDPASRQQRIEEIRRKVDRAKALVGNLKRTSSEEVEAILDSSTEDTMRRFHETFFELKRIPENKERYPYDDLKPKACKG